MFSGGRERVHWICLDLFPLGIMTFCEKVFYLGKLGFTFTGLGIYNLTLDQCLA